MWCYIFVSVCSSGEVGLCTAIDDARCHQLCPVFCLFSLSFVIFTLLTSFSTMCVDHFCGCPVIWLLCHYQVDILFVKHLSLLPEHSQSPFQLILPGGSLAQNNSMQLRFVCASSLWDMIVAIETPKCHCSFQCVQQTLSECASCNERLSIIFMCRWNQSLNVTLGSTQSTLQLRPKILRRYQMRRRVTVKDAC